MYNVDFKPILETINEFTNDQKEVIFKAIVDGVDPTPFYDPTISSRQMEHTAKNILYHQIPTNTKNEEVVEMVWNSLDKGIDIRKFITPDMTPRFVDIIISCVKRNIDPSPMIGANISSIVIRYIADYIHLIPDVSIWVRSKTVETESGVYKEGFSEPQLKKLLDAVYEKVDVSIIANPEMTVGQMSVLIKHLKAGKDISIINDPSIPPKKMEIIMSLNLHGIRLTEKEYSDLWEDYIRDDSFDQSFVKWVIKEYNKEKENENA
ncbi:MAG: hypothetical protein PHF63_00580 [Herbinix sp.]|nr:hypothetical protein [Herbinix sp.]